MNKVFKVIWSEARNAYVVVSEIAKNHGSKSCSTKKLLTMLIATGVMTCASMAPAMAGNPAPDDLNVTIGKDAHVSVWNGSTGQNINGDIAVGPNAHAWNGEYTYQNAKGSYLPRIGNKEYLLDFGQGAVEAVKDSWKYDFIKKTNYKVADGSKIAGSIAIGKNTVARTGSVMLGDHSYTGKLGDIEINPEKAMTYNDGIYSTTLGAGAYNSGSLAAVTGALSIASGSDTKNTGATIYGSLNSIESATSSSSYSGVASSVLGFANKTQNANAALIWGTGNEVTNSVEDIGIDTNWNKLSVTEAQQKAIEAMQSSKYAGGSVMAIGGGNKADYATYSQLTGVQNKVTGTEAKAAKYDFVNGYKNTVTEASDVTVIGSKNEVTADGNKVIGDNHKVSGKNNVIFGSADKLTDTTPTVNNSVALGHNAMVTADGGVALGAGSVANRANAVSVGSKDANRQIINVAKGTKDTDAVNVSQLKDVKAEAGKHTTLVAGDNVQVKEEKTDNGLKYTVSATDTTYTAGNGIAINGDNNAISVKLKAGEGNLIVDKDGLALNKNLKDIESISNGTVRLALSGATGTAGLINGKGASVFLMDNSTVINGVVGIDKTGKISSVANGEISATSKDAVNGSQLHQTNQNVAQNKTNIKNLDNRVTNVEEVAKKHTTVTKGDNIVVTEGLNKDGGKEYKVALDKDIFLSGDNADAFVDISGSKGTIWASGSVTAGSVVAGDVVMDSTTATVSGLSNKTIAYEDFATTGKAATEEQLKEVATEAGKHTTLVAGDNVTLATKETDKGLEYTVNAVDTTYTAGNGITIDKDADNAISVKLNKDEVNLAVDEKGLSLNKDLKGIESISNNTSKLVLREGWAGMQNGVGASVFMVDGLTTINGRVTVDEQGKISGVADGVADDDAVNVSQLNKVSVEAGKHTTLSDGKNTTVTSTVKDGQTDYKVNVAGDLNDITSVANGASKINLNADSISISNDNKSFAITNSGIGMSYIGADYAAKSIMLGENGTTISGGLNVAGSKITGVAAGTADTDAVNVSQLNKVSVEAGKHSVVTEGANITVTPEQAEDGRMQYNVALKNDIKLAGDNDYTYVNISGSNGSVWASSSVAAGNVIMDGTTETVSGLGNTTTAYDGFANGEGKAATEEQLKEVSKVAENANQGWNLSTNGGKASKVAPGETVDFSGDKNITISNDGTNVKVKLNENIDVNSVQTNALNSKYNLSVGTMSENGIMPFFVNSTGDFYAAHNKFHVDKDGKVTATAGEIGNVVLQNGVYYGHSTLQDGSLLLTDDNGNHSYIDAKSAKLGKVTVAEDGKISGVAAGAVTADSTDAVNGSQLHAVATEAGKHSKVVNGSNINVEETDLDGQKVYKVNLNKDIMLGDLTGKYVSISGTNGTIETTGYIATQDRVYADKGAKLADIDVTGNKISNGASSIVLDGSNVKVNDKVTIDQNGKISGVAAGAITADSTDAINGSQLHQTNENVAANRADIDKNKADIAALDNRVTQNEADIAQNKADIAQNKADIATNKADIATNKADIATNKANIAQNAADIKKVEALAKKHTTVTAGDNITVTEDTNKDGGKEYKVALDKDIKLDSVTTGQTVMNNDGLKVGKDVSVTATAVTAGKTSISDEGVKVGDKTYISDKGLNANDQNVTNVKAGELSETSKDAVNGSQLYKTNQEVANNTNRINQLGSRVNKVGAGAAALAALHPMDFDPDDKLTFSAGYGNYGGENAAAIGAYYRPDEKVMFSVGGTVGNGENMVNAGVSFSLDRTNHVSNSRTAMAREILDLRAEVTELKAMVAKGGLGSIAEDKMKIFPDVAENHWAYEYVGKLAAAGIIEGYPDGNFSGDRMMSRYEFAAMLYRAMQKGAQLDSKIINEFAPEMGRIRVDRISGEDGDRDKIERVRVNAVKGERDHYGNKIAKAEAKAK